MVEHKTELALIKRVQQKTTEEVNNTIIEL